MYLYAGRDKHNALTELSVGALCRQNRPERTVATGGRGLPGRRHCVDGEGTVRGQPVDCLQDRSGFVPDSRVGNRQRACFPPECQNARKQSSSPGGRAKPNVIILPGAMPMSRTGARNGMEGRYGHRAATAFTLITWPQGWTTGIADLWHYGYYDSFLFQVGNFFVNITANQTLSFYFW